MNKQSLQSFTVRNLSANFEEKRKQWTSHTFYSSNFGKYGPLKRNLSEIWWTHLAKNNWIVCPTDRLTNPAHRDVCSCFFAELSKNKNKKNFLALKVASSSTPRDNSLKTRFTSAHSALRKLKTATPVNRKGSDLCQGSYFAFCSTGN